MNKYDLNDTKITLLSCNTQGHFTDIKAKEKICKSNQIEMNKPQK